MKFAREEIDTPKKTAQILSQTLERSVEFKPGCLKRVPTFFVLNVLSVLLLSEDTIAVVFSRHSRTTFIFILIT
jgi:hypothetical protein